MTMNNGSTSADKHAKSRLAPIHKPNGNDTSGVDDDDGGYHTYKAEDEDEDENDDEDDDANDGDTADFVPPPPTTHPLLRPSPPPIISKPTVGGSLPAVTSKSSFTRAAASWIPSLLRSPSHRPLLSTLQTLSCTAGSTKWNGEKFRSLFRQCLCTPLAS